MSRLLFFFALLTALVLFSCDEVEKTSTAEPQELLIASDTLKIPVLSGLKPSLILTSEASKGVKKWTFYKNLSQGIDSLSVTTLGELKARVKLLNTVFENRETAEEAEVNSTPEMVQTEAIESRVLAIQTQLNVLRNHCARNKQDVVAIANSIVTIKNGLQHLNLQINERFSLSIKELLEEIKNEEDDTPDAP